MTFPNYRETLENIRADIESKTGLITRYKIDNQDITGDTPTLLLNLKGSINIKASGSGTVLSQEVLLVMELLSVASNPANIADILESEAKVTPTFPMSIDYKAAQTGRCALPELDGYTANYYSVWKPQQVEMQGDQYRRKWDLILTFYRRTN